MKRSRLKRKGSVTGKGRLVRVHGWESHKPFVAKSQEHFARYKRTGDTEEFGQAGEKLWNAFNLLVQQRLGRKVEDFGELRKGVAELRKDSGNRIYVDVFEDAYDLHKFFYRGWTEDMGYEEEKYKRVLEGIKSIEGIPRRKI
jgi:hypothetical protein